MKYSLRSLFVIVTLVCVLLGGVSGRIEYLRRWAVFHEREAERLIQEHQRSHSEELLEAISCHEQVGGRFRTSIYRPWTIVDSSSERLCIDEKKGIFETRRYTWNGDHFVWTKVPSP
jgi:hypothetical protein